MSYPETMQTYAATLERLERYGETRTWTVTCELGKREFSSELQALVHVVSLANGLNMLDAQAHLRSMLELLRP